MVSNESWLQRDQFIEARRAVLELVRQFTELSKNSVDRRGEGYSVTRCGASKCVLKAAEEAACAWESKLHGSQLPQELVPILDRDPFAMLGNGVEKVPEALCPAGR